MSRFEWHVSVKNAQPKKIRHYKHIKRLYQFILRNPAMFSGRMLTIYNHGQAVIDATYPEVKNFLGRNLSETDERQDILRIGRERNGSENGEN